MEWTFDTEKINHLWRVNSELIVTNESVVFFASEVVNGDGHLLFVSKENGELLNQIPAHGGWLKRFGNRIYWLADYFKIGSVDLIGQSVDTFDFHTALQNIDFRIWHEDFVVENQRVFFTQKLATDFARWGVLNLRSGSLEEENRLPFESGHINYFDVANQHVFIRTFDKKLWIYQDSNTEV